MKILLVEDSPMQAMLTRRMLQQLGYADITEATNGREALRFLEGQSFGLIITDWVMPKMDGLTLIRRIRATPMGAKTPILMVTSKGTEKDLLDAIQVGIDAFIVKPLKQDVLKAKIEDTLAPVD